MASAWGGSWGLSWGNSWGSLIQPPIVEPEFLQGGPGGSNKAGKGAKKKHDWERKGHVISAIQSGPTIDNINQLLEVPQFTQQASVVEDYIAENDIQIATLVQLVSVITAALKAQEENDQTRVERNKVRLEAHAYKIKVQEAYHKRQVRRRREEEAFVSILLHA